MIAISILCRGYEDESELEGFTVESETVNMGWLNAALDSAMNPSPMRRAIDRDVCINGYVMPS